tara:strand:- start:57019 stop:57237 length:219 start_codon:yes stop_codon:yes gene_type:complete
MGRKSNGIEKYVFKNNSDLLLKKQLEHFSTNKMQNIYLQSLKNKNRTNSSFFEFAPPVTAKGFEPPTLRAEI